MTVYVFGHRNPDTDAICSAIAYADYLQRTTRPDAIAACCGSPNKRTEFALRCAGLPLPRIIMDVRPEVAEVCRRECVVARGGEVFFEVYQRMRAHQLHTLPVIDPEQRVIGLLSLLDLSKLIFEAEADDRQSRTVETSLQQICQVLQGSFQHVERETDVEPFVLMVGAMSAEGFTSRLHQWPAKQLIVVTGDRPSIQIPAIEQGVRALVITGGYALSPGLLQLAKANGVSILLSGYDTATTTMRVKSARVIGSAIQKEFETLSGRLPISDAATRIERLEQGLFPVLDDSGKLMGILSKSDLVTPPRTKLVLVDHNELAQAVPGAEDAEILEVLDHHRIGGGLKTAHPIRFINDPVGSTCTLVARHFRAAGMIPTEGIALCMASGIISDTLFLRSPTTTQTDRECLDWLKGLCKIDLDQYVQDFFEVGSSLRSCTPEEVIREDCKEFEEHGMRFSISQIEETGFDLFWMRREELLEALQRKADTSQLAFSALLVTDIVSHGSMLLMSKEPSHWEEINYPRIDQHLYELKDVVSRKKQLLPLLSQLLDADDASRDESLPNRSV